MRTSPPTIRVVVADDHPLYLDSLVRVISCHPGFDLAGSARDGHQALAAIETETPDVAVLDIQMPGLDGLEVLARVRGAGLPTAAVLITGYTDAEMLYRAISLGVDGVLSKGVGPDVIARAITSVVAGEAVLSLQAQTALVHGERAPEREAQLPLTASERQVLALAADGLSNTQIAESLYLGAETVKAHLRSAYEKLKVSGRAAALSGAINRGLLRLPALDG
jgi:two-component system, NarL family, nitrate/nitrite response regulator NarL